MGALPPVLMVRLATRPFSTLEALDARDSRDALERVVELERWVEAEAASLGAWIHDLAGPPVAESGAGNLAVTVDARRRLSRLHARREVHQRRRAAVAKRAEACAAEDPELAGRLAAFAESLGELEAALAHHASRHEAEVLRAAARLAGMVREPLVEEGLRLVGRSLAAKAAALASRPPEAWKHRERHVALKLLAYVVRFSTKTSPQGVFCTTALGAWGGRTRGEGENRIARRETRIALGEARKIVSMLAVDPALAPLVVPRPNPTLRARDGTWEFWRPASARREEDDETRCSVRVHPLAASLLECCAPRRTMTEVLDACARRAGADRGELDALAAKMSASGLWIAEVEVPWSEPRPLRWLAARASSAGVMPEWRSRVEALEREVASLDRIRMPWPERRARLDAVDAEAEALPHHRPLDHDALLRVDAASALRVTLTSDVMSEIERFVAWYARWCAALYPRESMTDRYARRFLSRFPADTDVDALELYHGVFEDGEGEERPSAFPVPARAAPDATRGRSAFETVRERLAAAAREAARRGEDEVALESLEPDFPRPGGIPPWSCGLLFQIEAADEAAVDDGRFRVAVNGIYPGGGLAAARFADLHSGGARADVGPIARELRSSWSWLESDGSVVAEVSFMHGGRTANAGLRPSLFEHEIELPGDCATPGRTSIPLADLVVRFDSARRRFSLRSRAWGVEVRPILASGISPHGIVSFLVAVGQQDLQPLVYFPGFDVEGVRRWPRFTWGRVVVFRGRWVFGEDALRRLAPGSFFEAETLRAAERWRCEHQLPRHVFVHTARDPKPFYVDLESPWLLELMRARCGERPGAWVVTEMLPAPDAMWIADANGRYASEFLVHMRDLGRGVRDD